MALGRTNYQNGREKEYRVRDALQEDGYACFRAAGSKGKADILALKPGEILLVQVKKTNPQVSPAERAALLELARLTGGRPIVAYKPPRKPDVYRELTGPGPKDWQPFYTDEVGAAT